jgi:hypothetical protein
MTWFQHRPGSVRICDGKHATKEGCSPIGEAEILGVPRETAEARARLMAAAPDLLEACRIAKTTIHALAKIHDPAWRIYVANAPELKILEHAIAKAETAS